MLEKRFIESVNFPFSDVSEASGVEKGPGRPPYWEMVFWWTRKPLISARAIIAGCLLPENTNPTNFLRSIGIHVRKHRPDGRPVFEVTPHRVKPKLKFEGVKLLDPFACFGSIPLEGLRLGLSVTACDLLPVGYVFLKVVLEYPTKYGKKLIEDVKKWSDWVTGRLRQDSLIRELYDKDVAVYIGSWDAKCPSCGKWTPLVGNWWLARVEGDGGYQRLAWMEPRIDGERVEINVIDLNKMLGDNAIRKAKVEGIKVKVDGKEFIVPENNVEAGRRATCLHCGRPISQIDPETGKHYTETRSLPKEVKKRLEPYVKFALKTYNQNVKHGRLMSVPSWIKEIPATQRLLVKVKVREGYFEFEPCVKDDQEKLEKAEQEVQKLLQQEDPDVPTELVAPFGATIRTRTYGFDAWHKHFNSRQLLAQIKLVKLIRDVGKEIEEDELKERHGLSEEAKTYAEVVATCLSIGIVNFARHNALVNHWEGASWQPVRHVFAMRRPSMQWNWCDVNPVHERSIVSACYFLTENISHLNYLVSALCDIGVQPFSNYQADRQNAPSSKIRVLVDDATILGKLSLQEKLDLIITDPPYYNDVHYSELSDFYYVWLKRALSDVKNDRLKQRFLPEAFFEEIGDDWVEVSTQWEKYALSEVSLNPPRLGSNATMDDGVKHFQSLLNGAFTTMTSKLKDDGLLVTYYAHTSPDAWKALLVAGWEVAGLRVTNAFPIATESAQSIVSRGKLSMDTSIVVVYRKGSEGSIDASDLYAEMVEESAKRARELLDLGAIGRDLVVGTLAAALAAATKYREVRVMGRIDVGTLVDKYVYPASYLGLARALARKAELEDGVKSADGMFYLLVKSTLAGAKKKTLDSTDARIFSIGTSLDLNDALKTWRILRTGEKESGARVAKAKTLTLMEPMSADRSKLAELLEARHVGATKPEVRCTVDALQVLEYLAVAYPREEFRRRLEELKASYPAYVEDALTMARIMARVLPEEDAEKGLCGRIIEHLEPITPRLGEFTPQEVK